MEKRLEKYFSGPKYLQEFGERHPNPNPKTNLQECDPLSQNFRLDFPKFSFIEWNAICHFNSEISVPLALYFGQMSERSEILSSIGPVKSGQMLCQMKRKISGRTGLTRKVVLLKRWTSFSETNRPFTFEPKFPWNFGWMDPALELELPLKYRREIDDLDFLFHKCLKNVYKLNIFDYVSFRSCTKTA